MILDGLLNEFTPADQERLLSNPKAVRYLESCFDKFAYTFRPRPNNPARYDEQEAFCHNHDKGVAFAVGGNAAGCLGAEQEIYDPVKRQSVPVSKINKPFHVIARDENGKVVIAKADRPSVYGVADLYQVELSNGESIVVTAGHRAMSSDGKWLEIRSLANGGALLSAEFCELSEPVSRHRESGPCEITAIRFLRQDAYWDFSVEKHENYWMAGAWHHNTTIAACYKLAKFVTQVQEAPRHDTPFWIIGPSYEQTIEAIWKEKLLGRGLIFDADIDWNRVTWYELRSELPLRVPLKPWMGGNQRRNWCLEFKSSEQGREQMQARSLGGFFFSEQFAWGILTEVLRGMREYNFPGSKFAEFTPIDPVLSAPLEDMMERDELPEGWRVYRMNTKCNVEDPNSEVSEEWYNEFFGMVSDEMRETRETGAWSSYEGLIYPSFNRQIHLVENIEIPHGVIHKRGIDWGAGPSNAFVVLWGFKDSLGAWWIYDEYYTTRQDYTWEDHCREIHAKDGWDLVRKSDETWELEPLNCRTRWHYGQANFQVTYAPPDRPDLFRELGKYLLPCASANNNRYDGIETVRRHLKINEMTGEPKLFIDRIRCPNLARYMQTYRWMAPVKRAVNMKDARPIALEKNAHAPDACRYLLHSDATHAGLAVDNKWIDASKSSFNRLKNRHRFKQEHRLER